MMCNSKSEIFLSILLINVINANPDLILQCAGALMVLTLKVSSAAFNYEDGLLKEDDLRDAQKRYRLVKMPSLTAYFGYCLNCGTHLAGPVYEFKDYMDWIEGKGVRNCFD